MQEKDTRSILKTFLRLFHVFKDEKIMWKMAFSSSLQYMYRIAILGNRLLHRCYICIQDMLAYEFLNFVENDFRPNNGFLNLDILAYFHQMQDGSIFNSFQPIHSKHCKIILTKQWLFRISKCLHIDWVGKGQSDFHVASPTSYTHNFIAHYDSSIMIRLIRDALQLST